jgi:hypothetical protein
MIVTTNFGRRLSFYTHVLSLRQDYIHRFPPTEISTSHPSSPCYDTCKLKPRLSGSYPIDVPNPVDSFILRVCDLTRG